MFRDCITKSLLPYFLLVFALALAVPKSAAQAGYTVTTIDVPSSTETDCNDINKAGNIVGFYADSTGVDHGFEFVNGKFQNVNFPHASATLVYGVNDLNQAVGWYTDGSTGVTHGFLFSAGTFTAIDPPTSTYTNAWSINNTGEIVGTYIGSDGLFHGFSDVNGTYTTIDIPNAETSEVTGINNLGAMVGIFISTSSVQEGFSDVNGKLGLIKFPGSGLTSADRINDKGEIVGLWGASSAGPFNGYTKIGSTYTNFLVSGSTETRVRGLNNAGSIVGRYTDSAAVIHGFVATPSN